MSNSKSTRLNLLRESLLQLPNPSYPSDPWSSLDAWIAKALPIIRNDWPEFFDDFRAVTTKPDRSKVVSMRVMGSSDFNQRQEQLEWQRENNDRQIVQGKIINFLDGISALISPDHEQVNSTLETVLLICKRFPIFVRQLLNRERGRQSVEIADEYDVQYFLLALLRLHFDDVRPEVWTPNYAGGSSRMDFLLKQAGIVVEVKKTRETLRRDSELANQLIIDIERYAEYPGYKVLVCFVYDPDKLIDNPRGLELDLSGQRTRIQVLVVVSPDGM